MKTSLHFLFRSVFVLLLMIPSFALASDGSISGVVKDSEGALVADQVIVIRNTASHTQFTTKTEKMGTFGPLALPAGEYRFRIRAKCFKDYSRTVRITGDQALQMEISLASSCPKDTSEQ